MAGDEEQVRVWDKHGNEQAAEDTTRFDSWDICRREKRFPNGLIEFLSSDKGCGFPAPSAIQSYAWPALLGDMDVIGVAKTGSGKTLAFLLPAFMWLKKNKKSASPVDLKVGPAVLCLTPTRELCFQIYTDAAKFGEPVQITAACCFGGAPKREQEWKIREGPHCLIATPGRLNDFANSGVVRFDMCRFCILDEADRMLDMGFEPQIKQILDRVPEGRQTSLFTATWNREVRQIADKYISNPVMVQVGSDEQTSNANIIQHIEVCKDKDEKKTTLERILDSMSDEGACLCFCNTKRMCRDLNWEFSSSRYNPVELHGDLQQDQRDTSLNKFRSGESRLLFATDLAARGLDVRNCTVVVNYDAPKSAEDYIHRIGRTGRANDMGDSYTFMALYGEDKIAREIKGVMEKVGQEIPEALEDLVNGRVPCGGDNSWDKKDAPSWGGDNSWDKKDDKTQESSGSVERRVNPSDKGKTPYSYAEFKEFNGGDEKKADRMWNESKPVEVPKRDVFVPQAWSGATKSSAPSEEKRIHPSDKSKVAYSYAEFKDFSGGDDKKLATMWNESKAVEQPKAAEPEVEDEEPQADEDDHGDKRELEEADDNEESPSKRAHTDDQASEVDKVLLEGKGNTLSVQQLREWLTDQALETTGLKRQLVERAETAAQDSLG